jgi:hypothetical protein
MVGTTRFELATSPTPRVRSTRLSHVPTGDTEDALHGCGAGLLCLFLSVHPRRRAALLRLLIEQIGVLLHTGRAELCRQQNVNDSSLAHSAFHANRSAVAFHDLVRDVQAEAVAQVTFG